MSGTVLLVANRGEIALRVLRAAADLGIPAVAVHAKDDAASLHVRHAQRAEPLPGTGPAAYLDVEAILSVARDVGAPSADRLKLAKVRRSAAVNSVPPQAPSNRRLATTVMDFHLMRYSPCDSCVATP